MKLRKRVFAGILAGAMALMMAGCGGTTTDTSADGGVEALLQKADETMAGVTSMSSHMDMVMDMTLDKEVYSTSTSATIEGFYDPVKMKMDMSMMVGMLIQCQLRKCR